MNSIIFFTLQLLVLSVDLPITQIPINMQRQHSVTGNSDVKISEELFLLTSIQCIQYGSWLALFVEFHVVYFGIQTVVCKIHINSRSLDSNYFAVYILVDLNNGLGYADVKVIGQLQLIRIAQLQKTPQETSW